MQMSATILGRNYGLTGEEMNRVLFKLDFLKGEPGNYDLTEKGAEYAIEKYFHRGNGGYAQYNRDWTVRTFDDSIKDVLDISPELIKEVRSELTAERTARRIAQANARAQANADFIAKQMAEKASAEAAEKAAIAEEELIKKLKTGGKITLAVLIVLAASYGIYKLTPKIKEWWISRKKKDELATEDK